MENLRLSCNDVLSTATVILLWLSLACDAFPIDPVVGNSESTSQKVVDAPQAKKNRLLPLLLTLRPSRHDFIAAKPNTENGQQEIGLRRMSRSTNDYIYDDDSNNPHDNYIYTTPGSGEDDSYVHSTTADSSSENDTYVYTTTADPWS